MYYPIMLESVRRAKRLGLWVGIVTNGYWATALDDAELWLKPLKVAGLDELTISNDEYHSDEPSRGTTDNALTAAKSLGINTSCIWVDQPESADTECNDHVKVMFKGRAVELTESVRRRQYSVFRECPHENLAEPERAHLDPFGNVFVCQGLSIGNIREKSLKKIKRDYRPQDHPIIGPLLRGGPAELAEIYGLPQGTDYADHCHLCFLIRKELLSMFPQYLCPAQVYGISDR